MKKLLLLPLLLLISPLVAQSWQPMANLPSGRHHPVTFALNGKGYAVTGSNTFSNPTKDFYEYDPVNDSWSTLGNFPGSVRSFAIGIAHNGKGYLGFGATLSQYLNDLWRYDPQTAQWTQLASCPCSGRMHPAMIALGNKIYVGLGDDANGNLRDWWRYDINTNSWLQIADLPGLPRHHPFQFNAGGEVYAGMGHGSVILKDWYKLDTATNSWNAMQSFPGEGRVAGTQFSWNNFGFVMSGDGDNHSYMATGEMWRYQADSDSWTQFPPHPGTSRWAPGSFVINNEVFFFGGLNRSNNQFPLSGYKFDLEAATINLQEEALNRLSVFPNPSHNFIRWHANKEFSELQLFDLRGKHILSVPAASEELDVSFLKTGIYLLKFNDGKITRHSIKLVKQ